MTACPACSSGATGSFYRCGRVPVHSCLLLASHWVRRYDLIGKKVVEIGCGKGEFLTEMIRAGVASGVGVDPGVHPERIPADAAGRLSWVQGFFPQDFPVLDADAVICRHTLEHIAAVEKWMRTVRAAIGDRTGTAVLFGLPDVKRVLEEGAFCDVYYEHCSYFSTGSLARLFRRTGFEVVHQRTAYDGQYLIVEARPLTTPAPGIPPDAENDLEVVGEAADRFAAAHAAMTTRWQARLREVAEARPLHGRKRSPDRLTQGADRHPAGPGHRDELRLSRRDRARPGGARRPGSPGGGMTALVSCLICGGGRLKNIAGG